MENRSCSICGRLLDNENDPLSVDCGGDCWGCIGEIEAEMGCEQSIALLRQEYHKGLRDDWLPAPTVSFSLNPTKIQVYLENQLGEPLGKEFFKLTIHKLYWFGGRRTVFNGQANTNSEGLFSHPVSASIFAKSFVCEIQRGSSLWQYPVVK